MAIKQYKSIGELMLAREKEDMRKASKKSRAMYKGLKDWEKSQIRINKQDYLPHNKKEYTEFFGPYKNSFIAQRDSSLVAGHYEKEEQRRTKAIGTQTGKMDKIKEKLSDKRSSLKKHEDDLKNWNKKTKDLIPFNEKSKEDIETKKDLINTYKKDISKLESDSTNVQLKLDKLTNKKPKLY